jgi:hypothetical protein
MEIEEPAQPYLSDRPTADYNLDLRARRAARRPPVLEQGVDRGAECWLDATPASVFSDSYIVAQELGSNSRIGWNLITGPTEVGHSVDLAPVARCGASYCPRLRRVACLFRADDQLNRAAQYRMVELASQRFR